MKKCDKYEAYFLFRSEDEFDKHLGECEDCRSEHAKMQKVASLVKEVKPVYRKRMNQKFMAKAACISALMMFTFSFAAFNYVYNTSDYKCISCAEDSVIDDLGLPVDQYGLLDIN